MERLTRREFESTECEPYVYGGIESYGDSYGGEVINKLADYEDAEEQGLLLWLPVAEGSMVYVTEYSLECKHNYECPLSFDKYKCEADVRCQHEYRKYCVRETKFNHMMLDKIGKTVFLTKEEAEQALKQMGE